jgi:hypothetical protein
MIRRSRVFWWRISCDARRARLFRYLLMVRASYLPPSKRLSAHAPAKASRVRLPGRRDLRS